MVFFFYLNQRFPKLFTSSETDERRAGAVVGEGPLLTSQLLLASCTPKGIF